MHLVRLVGVALGLVILWRKLRRELKVHHCGVEHELLPWGGVVVHERRSKSEHGRRSANIIVIDVHCLLLSVTPRYLFDAVVFRLSTIGIMCVGNPQVSNFFAKQS
jgi:hypothetical protein